MKTKHLFLALLGLSNLGSSLSTAFAQGTAFTYQGRLQSDASPVTGVYDLRFAIVNDDNGGVPLGGWLTNSATGVTNGLFTVTLDFGDQFPGSPRWLEIGVRTNGGGAFTVLAPRQRLTATPYAVFAANAGTAAAANTVSGLTLNTNLSSVALGMGNTASANFATVNGGTANNASAAYATVSGGTQNMAGGEYATVSGGIQNTASVMQATVGGGFFNTASGERSVVAGGYGNQASGYAAFVGGGLGNRAGGNYATLGGGDNNIASGGVSFVGGGSANQATNAYATVPGGKNNLAGGLYSLAAGQRAKALHDGTFVWADQQAADFASTAADQFLIRASGGVGINTNNPNGAALAVNGNVTVIGTVSGVFTGSGAGLTGVNLSLNSDGAISLLGNFVLASSPVVGSGPESVTSADVNGDGKPDLISANYGSFGGGNTLTVLTNNGSGGFVLASSPGVGSAPRSVTSADVNGDGRPDLINANSVDNTLTVLTNNGSGGFVLASSPGVGSGPYSVTSVDVNGDGKPDLISANSGANTLTVLTNNGSGGFALSSSLGVGSHPQSVTSADVNGDGKPDLISANAFANTLTVYINNGSGGFAFSSSRVVGNFPRSLTSADVNGDGKPDLITANVFANTLTVLTNNGSGGFVLASSPSVGNGPYSVTSADVNSDGKPDLISANINADTLTVLTNNGSGGFVLASSPGVGSAPQSVTSADVNGDGRPDLISANSVDNTLTVLINATTFTGSFAGDGSGLANVALLAGGNTFTGNQTISGNVGIGLASPAYALDVQSSQAVGRFTTTSNPNGAVLALRNNTASPTYLGAINFEDSGTPGQIAYLASGQMTFRVGGVERMNLQAGGLYVNGVVVLTSDRNAKEDIAAVDAQAVLAKVAALPLQSWSYTNRPGVKHVGPMAQDFRAAFGLGEDDKHIATVDADGVALAAIQGLNQKLEETRAENAELKQRLAALEKLVQCQKSN